MNTNIKSTLVSAALVCLAATAATASSGPLAPVDRFDGAAVYSSTFDANVAALHVIVRPGDTLTARDREFAVDVMNSSASFAIKSRLIKALYAEDGDVITSSGRY